jgi:hypothetical protein
VLASWAAEPIEYGESSVLALILMVLSCLFAVVFQEVRTRLQPGTSSAKAELYKLNIMRPGDFFKSHVDYPRGPDMFGSLVICLPTNFTGMPLSVHEDAMRPGAAAAAAAGATLTNLTRQSQKPALMYETGQVKPCRLL